jgi:hypothetical protein
MNNLAQFQHFEIDKPVKPLSGRLEVVMKVMEHFLFPVGIHCQVAIEDDGAASPCCHVLLLKPASKFLALRELTPSSSQGYKAQSGYAALALARYTPAPRSWYPPFSRPVRVQVEAEIQQSGWLSRWMDAHVE